LSRMLVPLTDSVCWQRMHSFGLSTLLIVASHSLVSISLSELNCGALTMWPHRLTVPLGLNLTK